MRKPSLGKLAAAPNPHRRPSPHPLSRGFLLRWLSYAGPLTGATARAGPSSETLIVSSRRHRRQGWPLSGGSRPWIGLASLFEDRIPLTLPQLAHRDMRQRAGPAAARRVSGNARPINNRLWQDCQVAGSFDVGRPLPRRQSDQLSWLDLKHSRGTFRAQPRCPLEKRTRRWRKQDSNFRSRRVKGAIQEPCHSFSWLAAVSIPRFTTALGGFLPEPMCQMRAGESDSWFGIARTRLARLRTSPAKSLPPCKAAHTPVIQIGGTPINHRADSRQKLNRR